MSSDMSYRLKKKERLCSKKLIDRIFKGGGSSSISIFPIRVVYLPVSNEGHTEPVMIMTSVSKRHFKHAVKRNFIKRQLREAYRRNKHILIDALWDKGLALIFIWQADDLLSSAEVDKRMQALLMRIVEKI